MIKNSNTDIKEKDWKGVLKIVILAMRVVKPSLTDEEAKNIIVNLGNKIQIERLEKQNKLIDIKVGERL